MPKPLTTTEINAALKDLPGWSHDDDALRKTFKLDNFRGALAFIVRIGFEAEQRDHHPELTNVYNTVKIALNTHDADGKVTAKDVDLAKAIESIA